MTDLQQQRLNDYLDHMIQAIEQVGEYLDDVTEAHFLSTRLLQDGESGTWKSLVRLQTKSSKNSRNLLQCNRICPGRPFTT